MESESTYGRAEQVRLESLENHLHQWRRKPTWHQRFSGAAEQAFVRHRYNESVLLQRFSLAIAVTFYVSYLLFDALTFKRYTDIWIYVFIIGFCGLSVLFQTAMTFAPARERWGPKLTPLTLLVNGLGLSLAAAYCNAKSIQFPREVFTIHLLYVFFLLAAPFRIAAPIAIFNSLIYVCGLLVTGMNHVFWFELIYIQVGTVVLLGACGWLSEATQRKAWVQAQLLRALSERDGLTNLYNHRAFFERCDPLLRQAHRENCRIALAVLDLDYFKDYNDQHGHMAGDRCLVEVSAILSGAARRPLDMAARLGGEEFVLFWYDVTPQWAVAKAEEVRAQIEALKLTHPSAPCGKMTVSIGLTCVLPDAQPVATRLVNAADRALYQAKKDGRNTVRASWDQLQAVNPARSPAQGDCA